MNTLRVIANLFGFGIKPTSNARLNRQIAFVMLVLTGCYLVVELAFNARLLDVVGSLEASKVESIEQYGRLISGTAVALLLFGFFLKRRANSNLSFGLITYLFYLPVVLSLCAGAMLAVYVGQKMLVDKLVEISTPEDRRRAAVLVPMSKLIKDGTISIPSLTLDDKDFETPQGKTFLATFALQAISHPKLFDSLDGNVETIFRAFSERERKHVDGFYDIYRESEGKLKDQFGNQYREASLKYANAIGFDLIKRQHNAWSDYEEKLRNRRRNLNPSNVPRAYWGSVRADVQRSGIPVGKNWAPSDRIGFNQAVAARTKEKALDEFHNRSRSDMGLEMTQALDPGLSYEQFITHPAILYKWKSSLSLPNSLALRTGISKDEFGRVVYQPAIENDVRTLMKKNYASAREYGPHGRQRKTGEDAYRILIVPPVALVFSLMGAMTHIFKIIIFIRKLKGDVVPRAFWTWFSLYLCFAAAIPLQLTNNVTQQDLFLKLEAYTKEGIGGVNGQLVAGGIRWAIQFQTVFHPVNEFVRTKLLSSPMFEEKIIFPSFIANILESPHE